MATTKRISGDYNIVTLQANNNVTISTNTVNVVGNMQSVAISATDIVAANSITAVGNAIAAVFIGDGSGLTNIPAGNASANRIQNGTSKVDIPSISGNIEINVGGVANVMKLVTTGAIMPGNITVGNILTDNYYFANGSPFISGGTVTFEAQATAPANSVAGDFWFSTTNGILYQYVADGTSDQWVDMSGVATPPATSSATANTVVERDTNASFTANVITVSEVVSTGNVTGNYFVGNGSQLTGVQTGAPSNIVNGTSQVNVTALNGNINVNVAGVTVSTFVSSGLAVGNVINLNANGVGNIGNSSGYFNRIFATSTSALYADLAEVYTADQNYDPGTVMIFAGPVEITQSTNDHDTRVAGVVSTNPAYIMNSGMAGVALALTGRVPCWVQGPVHKGEILVTGTQPGTARRLDKDKWKPGCVIGKSMTDIDDDNLHLVTISVGRF
jgi:hypothetical protein